MQSVSVTAISLGAGIQSSAMVYLANEGIIQADFAIFADTGNERDETYKYLEYLEKNSKIPIVRARNTRSGTITEDLEKAVNDDSKYWEGMPPLWFSDERGNGQARQQCTTYYKIKVVEKFINQKAKADRQTDRQMLIGISVDEIHRANSGKDGKIKREFPLIKLRMSRSDCAAYIQKLGHPLPPKSGCLICPYAGVKNYRSYSQKEIDEVIRFDEMIRDGFAKEKTKGRNRQYFLSSRRVPVKRLIEMEASQNDLFGEMDGCDSGFCYV